MIEITSTAEAIQTEREIEELEHQLRGLDENSYLYARLVIEVQAKIAALQDWSVREC